MKYLGKLVILTMLILQASCLKTGVDPTITVKGSFGPTFYATIDSIQNINSSNVGASQYTAFGYCTDDAAAIMIIINDGTSSFTESTTCSANAYSVTFASSLSTLMEGSINISVDIDDVNGNHYDKNYSIIKDVVVPSATINSVNPINLSNYTAYPLSGTCNDSSSKIKISVASSIYETTCNGATWSTALNTSTVTDGNPVVNIKIEDPASNIFGIYSNTVIKDIVPPNLVYTLVPLNAGPFIFNIKASCIGDNGRTINYSIYQSIDDNWVQNGSATCGATISNEVTFILDWRSSPFTDQDYYMKISTTDLAGNFSGYVSSANVTRDKTPPTAATISLDTAFINGFSYANLNNMNDFRVSGTCEIAGGSVYIAISSTTGTYTAVGAGYIGVPCSGSNTYSVSLNFSSKTFSNLEATPVISSAMFATVPTDSNYFMSVQHNDLAGNSVYSFEAFTLDTTPPNLVLGTYPNFINQATLSDFYISGTCSGTEAVSFYLEEESPLTSGDVYNCSADNFTFNTDLSLWNLVDGNSYTINLSQQDSAGNTTIINNIIIPMDITPPPVATLPVWEDGTGPFKKLVLHPSWTPGFGDTVSQTLLFYQGSSQCGGTPLTPVTGLSSVEDGSIFIGEDGFDYSFQVKSYDAAGNNSTSSCSTYESIALPTFPDGSGLATGFGTSGRKSFGVGARREIVQSIAVLPNNGGVFAVGEYADTSSPFFPHAAVVKLNATTGANVPGFNSGSLLTYAGDTYAGLGGTGRVIASEVVIDNSGNIAVVATDNDAATPTEGSVLVKKINGSSGATINSINLSPIALPYGFSIGYDRGSDKFIIGGKDTNVTSNAYIGTLNNNLTIDNRLSGSTWVKTINIGAAAETIYSVSVNHDGSQFVCGGYGIDGFVMKLTSNGSLDTSWNTLGTPGYQILNHHVTSPYDHCHKVKMSEEGKVITVGNYGIKVFTYDGYVDTSFGGSGSFYPGYNIQDFIIQGDRKIVASGVFSGDFKLVRLDYDGSLDLGFGTSGYATIDGGNSKNEYTGYSAIGYDSVTGAIYFGGGCGRSTSWDFCVLKLD